MRELILILAATAVLGCKDKAASPLPPTLVPDVGPLIVAPPEADLGPDLGRPATRDLSEEPASEVGEAVQEATDELLTALDLAGSAAVWAAAVPLPPASIAGLNKVASAGPPGLAKQSGGRTQLTLKVGEHEVRLVEFENSDECTTEFLEVPKYVSRASVRHELVWWVFGGAAPEQTVALALGTRVGAWHWNAEKGCVARADVTKALLGPEATAADTPPAHWPVEELGAPRLTEKWSWEPGEPTVDQKFEIEGLTFRVALGADRWALSDAEGQPIAEFHPKMTRFACGVGAERRTYDSRTLVLLHGAYGEDDCSGEKNARHEFGALTEWSAGGLVVRSRGRRTANEYTYEGESDERWSLRSDLGRWSLVREIDATKSQNDGVGIEGDDDHCLNVKQQKRSTKWTVRLDDRDLFSSTAHEDVSTHFVDGCI